MIYNFIFSFFKISLIYILKSLFILFCTFYIFYKFDKIFSNRFYLIYYLYILFRNFIIINNTKNVSSFFLKKVYSWKNHSISVSVIPKRYILILSLAHSSALPLKYLRAKRTRRSLETWVARKYNSHTIIYNSNLAHCFQNLDNKFDFFLLSSFDAGTHNINPFAILIFDRILNITKRSKTWKNKVFRDIGLNRFILKIISIEWVNRIRNHSN